MTTVRGRLAPVGPQNHTQILRLGCRFLFPPSHLSGPGDECRLCLPERRFQGGH